MSEGTTDQPDQPAAKRDAETPPPPDPEADADATADAERAEYPPVDADGSFTRIWNDRLGHELTNRLADEQERRESREWLDQFTRETLEKAKATADREDAQRLEEEIARVEAERRSAPESADEATRRRLEALDRFGPLGSGEPPEPDDSGGPADPR